jgi:nucleoside transporter
MLWVMMFLQFFVWGAWLVTMGTYLTKIGFTGPQVGLAYSANGYAAIIAPLFVGIVADRFFNAERLMGVLHLVGAGLLYWASTITEPTMFFIVLLAYSACYMPTLALVNAISFGQMKDPAKEFPAVRVLGTIGWIAAGWVIIGLGSVYGGSIEGTATPLQLAAVASAVLGVFSFVALPKTPPAGKGKSVSFAQLLGLDAIGLLKDRSFAVFTLSSLLVCIPLSFYYSWCNAFLNEIGMENAAGMQSFGQVSEILFMLVLPLFLARFGVKLTLLIGMAAWTLRYVLFAYGGVENTGLWSMLLGGILLHGICYDFFFVTGQLYVDKRAPQEIRASAQGFIALVTYGVGMVIGNYIAGAVVGQYTTTALVDGVETATHAWQTIWLFPAGMAAVVVVLFALLFNDKKVAQA